MSPSVSQLDQESRDQFQQRLKRIEGQARGIQRMIDEGRDCVAIIDQIAAARAAMNSLSADMIETFALYCLNHPDDFATNEAAVAQAVKAIVRSGR
ncbi:MAG: metal-sensitive transcriptional regulator [Thermomicrobiales bacterium]|nr:metal-sensitive transcriptional regulator [Thermomicrobiales bacterium]